MADIFSGGEILDVALQIERNGHRFYAELRERAENDKVKELASYLAEQELQHIRDFEALKDRIGDFQPPWESYPGEYEAYMRALAEGQIFNDPVGKKLLEGATTEDEALFAAMGFEKDSIVFYSEMARLVPERERNVVEELARQEREHLMKLSRMRREMERRAK